MFDLDTSSVQTIGNLFREYRHFIGFIFSSISLVLSVFSITFSIGKDRKTEKNKMYQQLEFLSIEFFKWESEHRETLTRIRKEFKNISDISPEDEIFLETWCAIGLNLFEVMIHNTLNGNFPANVFGSWLPWIHEFANEHGFKEMWESTLRIHYLPECREIIDNAIKYYDNRDKFVEKTCNKHKKLKKDKLNIEEWMK